VSSSQIIGNNAGAAVPVAVDSAGAVRAAVSGPVSGNLYADDAGTPVAVSGTSAGAMFVQALGTTSGGIVTPLLVDSQGRVVTSGGSGPAGPPGPPGFSTAVLPYRSNTTPGTGNPGSARVQWNNSNQLLSTQIQIASLDDANVDVEVLLASLPVGGSIRLQDRSLSSDFQLWTVTASPVVVAGSYVRVPVSLASGTWTSPSNHQIVLFLNLGATGAVPLYSEIPLFHADVATTSATPVRLSSRAAYLDQFPATANGLNRVVRLRATLQSSSPATTASLQLADITLSPPVNVTNAALSVASASPSALQSSAIPVGNTSGELWITPAHLYELTLAQIGTSPGTAVCSGAWLSISYE